MKVIEGLGISIPEAWSIATLGEVTSKIGSGATPRGGAAVYVEDGVRFIRSQNIYDHEFRSDGLVWLDEDSAESLSGVSVQKGDALINITGDSVLRVAEVPEAILPARVNQHVAIVRPNGAVLPGFLQKWLSQAAMKDFMLAYSAGGTRKAITKADLVGFPIALPPLTEQRAIAATLGALDDKIESNRRVQQATEQLLRALVNRALQSASAENAKLADYCKLVKEPAAVSELDSDSSYISFEHMPKGSISLTEWGKQDGLASAKSRFIAGDVLFGKLRPYFKKVGIAPVDGVCSNDILVLRPISEAVRALVAVVASSDELIDHVSSSATGTRMPRASWGDVAKWAVPKLSQTEIEVLGELTAPLVDTLVSATHENRRLIELRDALLPELLSGRIRATEAAEQVESPL